MLYKYKMTIELWQAIKAARKAAGLSQEALGAACEPPVSKAAVGLWEHKDPNKRTTPKYQNLLTIRRLTGFSSDEYIEKEKADPRACSFSISARSTYIFSNL